MRGILRNLSKSYRLTRREGQALLAAVLAQAREPVFYEDGGVADTVTGRFDMIALHAFLAMRAMRYDPQLKELNQEFLDGLFANIDSSFREMGVSDPGVPRKMKQAAEAFYGRLAAYEKGLAEGGLEGLKGALERNLYRGEHPGDVVLEGMARYVLGSLGTLALLDGPAWRSAHLCFPRPDFAGAP